MTRYNIRVRLFGLLVISLLLIPMPASWANLANTSSPPDAALLQKSKELLGKSLTIFEIDREVEKLSLKEAQIAKELEATNAKIEEQTLQVEDKREHAGKVLRAYYTGERDQLWMVFLSSDSLSDAISALEFIQVIIDNDFRMLRGHQEEFERLVSLKDSLLGTQEELKLVKFEFLKQRERLVALEEERNEQLQTIPEEAVAVIQQQIEDLTNEWETIGLPTFRLYFSELSKAVGKFEELINKDRLKTERTNIIFTVTDDDLNKFIRSKNTLFNQFAFEFKDGEITAKGQDGDVQISLSGKYVVENKPDNVLRFYLHKLTYNDFDLPDTTMAELDQEFDLALNPSNFFENLEATGVKMEEGKLIIEMVYNF